MIKKHDYKQWIDRVKSRVDKMEDIAFVLHRNNNENMVCYKNDAREGCKPFWIMFEKEGHPYEDLTILEKQFGYGLNPVSRKNNYIVMNITAFKERDIVFMYDDKGQFSAYAEIKGAVKKVKAVHLEIKTFVGIIPTVEYMEIFGEDGSYEKYYVK